MSIVSSRSSHASLMRSSLAHRKSLVGVRLSIDDKTVGYALRQLLENNSRPYEDLVCALRDGSVSETNLKIVLKSCSLCVGATGREAKLFVEALYSLDWPSMSDETVDLFSKWTLNLLTAQIHHTPTAMESLVKLLAKSTTVWEDFPPNEQSMAFSHVHRLIAQIVSIIPMSNDVLLNATVNNFPYYKQSVPVNRAYVYNMLWITRYLPSLSDHLLTLILNRLIIMDVNLRCRDSDDDCLFSMDETRNSDDLTESLDVCMVEVFQWVEERGTQALDVLISVFHNIILPTHGTNNIQFIMFYALSLDPKQVSNFLNSLWHFVASARIGPGLRQAAVTHLTGLLARANYISLNQIKFYINKMADWCHSYVQAQDNVRPNDVINPHSVFYSVTQSLFYLIAFKHKSLFFEKEGLVFVQSLNLPRIVMSSLNPLRACHAGIAESFASVTRIHQIVYCQTVMEHNSRHFIRCERETFNNQEWFPYDPYTLTKSYKWIQSIYGEYQGHLSNNTEKNVDICEEDDFLATSPNISFMPRSLNSISSIVR